MRTESRKKACEHIGSTVVRVGDARSTWLCADAAWSVTQHVIDPLTATMRKLITCVAIVCPPVTLAT